MQLNGEGTSLRSSEWLLISSLGLLFVSLFAVSKFKASQFSSRCGPSPVHIEVVIEGFVNKPGAYQIAKGVLVGEAVKKARPKRFADLRSLDLSAKVLEPLRLNIGKLEVIKISVVGAVANPGAIEVPVGARVCDLKKNIRASSETDLSFFKRRRLLKDGETICIPRKKE